MVEYYDPLYYEKMAEAMRALHESAVARLTEARRILSLPR